MLSVIWTVVCGSAESGLPTTSTTASRRCSSSDICCCSLVCVEATRSNIQNGIWTDKPANNIWIIRTNSSPAGWRSLPSVLVTPQSGRQSEPSAPSPLPLAAFSPVPLSEPPLLSVCKWCQWRSDSTEPFQNNFWISLVCCLTFLICLARRPSVATRATEKPVRPCLSCCGLASELMGLWWSRESSSVSTCSSILCRSSILDWFPDRELNPEPFRTEVCPERPLLAWIDFLFTEKKTKKNKVYLDEIQLLPFNLECLSLEFYIIFNVH